MSSPRTTVTAGPGGRAAGRDYIEGIPPADLAAIVAAATGLSEQRAERLEKLTQDQRDIIAQLECRLEVTEAQLISFFRVVGDCKVQPEDLGAQLMEIATRMKKLVEEVAAKQGDDPKVASLKTTAHEALMQGNLNRADALLANVADEQSEALDSQALELASTLAQRAEIAMTQMRYREAARHFAQAAARVPTTGYDVWRFIYLGGEAEALYRCAEMTADKVAALAAVECYRSLLVRRPREQFPLDWAEVQTNLGNALGLQGKLGSDNALRSAVDAYEAALECYNTVTATGGITGIEWVALVLPGRARTQSNLGSVLLELGERGDQDALRRAVALQEVALKELSREVNPGIWAKIQRSLGVGLLSLGIQGDAVALRRSVEAFEAALEV